MDSALIRGQVTGLLGTLLGRGLATTDQVLRTAEPRWDSLKHLELVFALEDLFEIRLDPAEMAGLDSLEHIVAAVERHHAP